jgi:hypothetical protein
MSTRLQRWQLVVVVTGVYMRYNSIIREFSARELAQVCLASSKLNYLEPSPHFGEELTLTLKTKPK